MLRVLNCRVDNSSKESLTLIVLSALSVGLQRLYLDLSRWRTLVALVVSGQ